MNHQIKKSNLSEERLSKIKKHISENYIDTNKYIQSLKSYIREYHNHLEIYPHFQ